MPRAAAEGLQTGTYLLHQHLSAAVTCRHLIGTCCESISWLVAYDVPWPPGSPPNTSTGKAIIGSDLPLVRYCPWCGHSKTKKRKQRRKAGAAKARGGHGVRPGDLRAAARLQFPADR